MGRHGSECAARGAWSPPERVFQCSAGAALYPQAPWCLTIRHEVGPGHRKMLSAVPDTIFENARPGRGGRTNPPSLSLLNNHSGAPPLPHPTPRPTQPSPGPDRPLPPAADRHLARSMSNDMHTDIHRLEAELGIDIYPGTEVMCATLLRVFRRPQLTFARCQDGRARGRVRQRRIRRSRPPAEFGSLGPVELDPVAQDGCCWLFRTVGVCAR